MKVCRVNSGDNQVRLFILKRMERISNYTF